MNAIVAVHTAAKDISVTVVVGGTAPLVAEKCQACPGRHLIEMIRMDSVWIIIL